MLCGWAINISADQVVTILTNIGGSALREQYYVDFVSHMRDF